MNPSPTRDVAEREALKIRRLRALVRRVNRVIMERDLPLLKAVELVHRVKARAMIMFPGRERTFDLLYAPRFARVLQEKYGIHPE